MITMKKIIDVTGEIYTGMWSYGYPFPEIEIKELGKVDFVKYKIYAEVFEGMNSQCGTYLETPAHLLGDKSYPLIDVEVQKLYEIPTAVLLVDTKGEREISKEMLVSAFENAEYKKGDAILICANYGDKWKESDYLSNSPYISYEAMKFLIEKEPYLLGTDFPRWDNLDNPQGFWKEFYDADILMLAPLVNLEKAKGKKAELTVLPIKVEKTCCAPCRAVLKIED